MFIDKIKAKFKEKYPNVNLSKDKLDALAVRLNKLVKEDDQIETILDTANLSGDKTFEEQAKDDDAKRNADAKAKKEAEEAKAKADAEAGAGASASEEIPAWAKAIIDDNKSLKEQLQASQQQSTQEKRTSDFKAKIKDLPEDAQARKLKAFNLMNFESDELFLEHLTDVEADVTSYTQTVKDASASGYRPRVAAASGSTITKAEQAEIDSAMEHANF